MQKLNDIKIANNDLKEAKKPLYTRKIERELKENL
jgi:hypothetical protein